MRLVYNEIRPKKKKRLKNKENDITIIKIQKNKIVFCHMTYNFNGIILFYMELKSDFC